MSYYKAQTVFTAVVHTWSELSQNIPKGVTITTSIVGHPEYPLYQLSIAPSEHIDQGLWTQAVFRILGEINDLFPLVNIVAEKVGNVAAPTIQATFRYSEKDQRTGSPIGIGVPPGFPTPNSGWHENHGAPAHPCSPLGMDRPVSVVIHSAGDAVRQGQFTIPVPGELVMDIQVDRLGKLRATGLSLDEWRAQEMDWLQARIESGTLDDFLTVESRRATEIINSGGFAANILGQMPLLEQSIAVAKCIQDAVKKSKDRSEMIDRLIELNECTPTFGTYLLGTTEYPPAHMKDSATRGCYLKGVDNGMWVMMKLKTADTQTKASLYTAPLLPPVIAHETVQISGTPLLRGLLGLLAGSQPVVTLEPAVTYGLDLTDWQEAVWTAILLSDRGHCVRNIHKLTLILHANKAPVRIEYTESLGLAPVRVDGVWMGVQVVPA